MRRSTIAALVAVLAVVLSDVPAAAATKDISIVSTSAGFDPEVIKGAMGTTFRWTNDDGVDHISTQDSPLRKWNTGVIEPNQSSSAVVRWAGTYPYHCAIHPSMTGRVRVPIAVGPSSGTVDDTYTITAATENAPSGFVYDVQMKQGNGSWANFKRGLTSSSTAFDPDATGTYSFRSRLRKKSNGATSGWSIPRTIVVS